MSDQDSNDYDENDQIEQNDEENRSEESAKEDTDVVNEAAIVNKEIQQSLSKLALQGLTILELLFDFEVELCSSQGLLQQV